MKTVSWIIAFLLTLNIASALELGESVPDFQVMDDEGKDWKFSENVGDSMLVFYFYPADMTPGCTKQACSYRDNMTALKDKGYTVIGVSGDEVMNHQVFKREYNLNYKLLSDTKGSVAAAFGVPYSKGSSFQRELNGKQVTLSRGVTTKRWTFVVGKDGKLLHKNTKVNAPFDSKDILSLKLPAKE